MRDRGLHRWRTLIRDRADRDGRELPLDVVEELACHLADLEASAIRGGCSDDEAHRRALDALSAASFLVLSTQPRARAARRGDHLPTLVRDVRYALRQLRRSPGFTATALITLAIGIGANTAIFTLVHAVLLESLPVSHAGQLYQLGDEYDCCTKENLQGSWSMFSYPFYREIRDQISGFEELAAMETLRPGLSVRRGGGSGVAEPFTGELVSGNYFTTLGVQALAGRLIAPADDRQGAGAVAVASYAAWQKYGFDASVIGRPLTINGVSLTLVGVTPPAFFGDRLESHPPDFWMPFSLEPTFTRESSLLEEPAAGWLYIMGRLRPGAQPAQVQAQLTTSLRRYLRVPGHVNPNEDRKKIDAQVIRVAAARGGINAMKGDYQQGLILLLAVSAAVLLIACANLANLLLARGAAQRVRTAVELAMGASRGRILRQHLTESFVLSLGGGAAGLLTAVYASRAILLMAFRGAPSVPIDTTPSVPILVFTFAVSVVTGVLFGAGPAWLASRSDPADALRGSSRVVSGAAVSQRSLVILQAALSLALVTVAGLLTQSLRNLDRQAFGFEPTGRLVVQIDPQSAGYTQARLVGLYRQIDDRLSRLPGVISESLSLFTAQQGNGLWGGRIYTEAGTGPSPSSWDRVGARYFETIGTPIVRGRGIGEHDTADAQHVAVVNETFARQYFPDRNPIGRHFGKYEPGHARDYEIVGVAADAKYIDASRAVRPMFFVPLLQQITYAGDVPNRIEQSSMYMSSIELHVHGDPDAMAPAVRAALAGIDPNLPPTTMTSVPELIRITTSERTLIARLSDAFGVIALLLAAVGLYGVTAYRVARRTSEFGLRMALGATRGDIAALVIRGACAQIAVGLIAGVPLALLAARALRHQLFGVSPFNLPALALAAAVVGGCALLASALPARRATAIAPIDALRTE
jgi:predicted permease